MNGLDECCQDAISLSVFRNAATAVSWQPCVPSAQIADITRGFSLYDLITSNGYGNACAVKDRFRGTWPYRVPYGQNEGRHAPQAQRKMRGRYDLCSLMVGSALRVVAPREVLCSSLHSTKTSSGFSLPRLELPEESAGHHRRRTILHTCFGQSLRDFMRCRSLFWEATLCCCLYASCRVSR